MKIKTDLHIHTLASGNAFSTVREYCEEAKAKGLEAICFTENGPAMKGSITLRYFEEIDRLHRKINGINVLRGVEANVISHLAELDIPFTELRKLDLVMVAMHEHIMPKGTYQEVTETWLRLIRHPYVDVLSQPACECFAFDLPMILKECKQSNKVMEINESLLHIPKHKQYVEDLILGCKRFEVPIVVSSNAHYCTEVGEYGAAVRLLKELDYPEERIINRSYRTLYEWLTKKRPWLHDLPAPAKSEKRVGQSI